MVIVAVCALRRVADAFGGGVPDRSMTSGAVVAVRLAGETGPDAANPAVQVENATPTAARAIDAIHHVRSCTKASVRSVAGRFLTR
jgi:hypothetical protein